MESTPDSKPPSLGLPQIFLEEQSHEFAPQLMNEIAQKRSHRSYSAALKLAAVVHAEKSSKTEAGRKYLVDPKQIRHWCKIKDQLIQQNAMGSGNRKRLKGGGRKPMSAEFEQLMVAWVQSEMAEGRQVNSGQLRAKAQEVHFNMQKEKGISEITPWKPSNGWVGSFFRRHNQFQPVENYQNSEESVSVSLKK